MSGRASCLRMPEIRSVWMFRSLRRISEIMSTILLRWRMILISSRIIPERAGFSYRIKGDFGIRMVKDV